MSLSTCVVMKLPSGDAVASPEFDLDEKVTALVTQTRALVGQAHLLARSIDATVEELAEFTDDLRRGTPQEFHERRRARLPFEGDDRRA